MKPPHSYVLVLNHQSDDLHMLQALLELLRCPLIVTSSTDQAMQKMSQSPPYLVILVGNYHYWSKSLINDLRDNASKVKVTIVALTDVHAPNWLRQEENPGVDGFLVKPLSPDVMSSVVQAAWAKQTYCSV